MAVLRICQGPVRDGFIWALCYVRVCLCLIEHMTMTPVFTQAVRQRRVYACMREIQLRMLACMSDPAYGKDSVGVARCMADVLSGYPDALYEIASFSGARGEVCLFDCDSNSTQI